MAQPRSEDRMNFLEHLGELRKRLFYCMGVIFVLAVAAMSFAPELFEFLRAPLADVPGQKLIVLTPLELYVTYLKLAVMAALFVGAPFVLWQIWRFVSPGLYSHEKRWVWPFILFGTLFFLAGGAFAFYVVLPLAFKYVGGMMPENIEAQYSVAAYFATVTTLMLAFAVVFELPLVMWILAAAGVVKPQSFAKIRRYWVVIAFIIAAILTPPDPFTQTLMAVPLVVFFELGVLGARFLYKDRRSQALERRTV